jgi:hypothetical protein
MYEDNEGVSTIGELIERDEHAGKRALMQIGVAILIAIGLLFTGYLNFLLYSRAFSESSRVFALIPSVLIEGSLAMFLMGSFVWFSHGLQGSLAKIFGWVMFVIVALNCVVEFNAQISTEESLSDFLRLYSFWGVPIVIPLVIGFWKAVIDSDPAIQIARQRRKMNQVLQIAKIGSEIDALRSEDSRKALAAYGQRAAANVNRRLANPATTANGNRVPVSINSDGANPTSPRQRSE